MAASAPDLHFRMIVQDDVADSVPSGIEVLCRRRSSRVRRALEGLRPVGPTALVHGLDTDLPVQRGPMVATIHDLTVFDLPWTTDRLRAVGERLLVARSIRRADELIAVSAFTAERIRSRFGREATVVHSAPSPGLAPAAPEEIERVRKRYDLPATFVLYLGNIEPRKNIGLLAEAAVRAGLPLLVAGGRWGSGRSPTGARELGYVVDGDLPGLYGAATAFGFPSLYEGFGFPPLEAMACGVPVVASRIPAHEEVLGEAAELAPLDDPAAWADCLRALAADPDRRAVRIRAGRERVESFSWARTADQTVAVYRKLGL